MTTATRSARLGLCATPRQEAVSRRAAEVSNKSMTDFILDSAYQAAEQTLLDQRLFLATGSQSTALLALLDRPARDNSGLKDLFSWTASTSMAGQTGSLSRPSQVSRTEPEGQKTRG